MDLFLKCAAVVLMAVTVYPILAHKDKSFAMLMALCVCCIVLISALEYLDPVMEFFQGIQSKSGIDASVFAVLIKITGLGLLSEIAALICTDAGNTALAKAIGILASITVLWMSLPLMQKLLDLITEILNLV